MHTPKLHSDTYPDQSWCSQDLLFFICFVGILCNESPGFNTCRLAGLTCALIDPPPHFPWSWWCIVCQFFLSPTRPQIGPSLIKCLFYEHWVLKLPMIKTNLFCSQQQMQSRRMWFHFGADHQMPTRTETFLIDRYLRRVLIGWDTFL